MTSDHLEFGQTNWSLIRELQSDEPERRQQALTSLVETYQGPVYAYFRRFGCDPEKASELTQSFFVEKVLVGGFFEKADPARARLRTLLRTLAVELGDMPTLATGGQATGLVQITELHGFVTVALDRTDL